MREGGGGNSCMKSINYSCCAPLLACAFSLSDFLLYLLGSPCSNLLLNGTSCFFFFESFMLICYWLFFLFFFRLPSVDPKELPAITDGKLTL